MSNMWITKQTKYGKLAYDAQTGRVTWAENNVWENWVNLANEGILGTFSPDGYLIEVYIIEFPNVHWDNKRIPSLV